MIKANELRIGNWIKGAYEFQIEEIKKNGTYAIYDPIPLTPEILEVCGFENDPNDKFRFFKYPFEYNIYNKIAIFKTSVIENPVEFLHQFQNSYFALTGEELNVNLHVESPN